MDALRRLDHVGVALGVGLGAACVHVHACQAAAASESDLSDFVNTGKKVTALRPCAQFLLHQAPAPSVQRWVRADTRGSLHSRLARRRSSASARITARTSPSSRRATTLSCVPRCPRVTRAICSPAPFALSEPAAGLSAVEGRPGRAEGAAAVHQADFIIRRGGLADRAPERRRRDPPRARARRCD